MRCSRPVIAAGLLVLVLQLHGVQLASEPQGTSRVSGRVIRSDTGGTVRGAVVELTPSSDGETRRANTDPSGHFEFTGLPAGNYRLTVTATGLVSTDATVARPSGIGQLVTLTDGQHNSGADLFVSLMGSVEGLVLDESETPVAGVTVALAEVRYAAGQAVLVSLIRGPRIGRTDDAGRFRFADLVPGDYYVVATPDPFAQPGSDPTPARSDEGRGYITTYFPGVDRALSAGPVRVEVGRHVDATFALVPARLARISGTVRDQVGRPQAGARLLLMPTENGAIRADVRATATSDAQGVFTYRGIPVGTYVLKASVSGSFGSASIALPTLNEEPVEIEVRVRPRVRARGRLSFEGGPPPARSLVDVRFVPADFTSGPFGGNRLTSQVNDDWTFEITRLAWKGCIRVRAPGGWALKSVRLDGRDITDVLHDFQTSDVNGLEVVMTNRLASIGGTVTSGGTPADDATIVVFADDQTKWAHPSRFVRVASAGPQGEFRVADLLPGRYRVIAVPPEAVVPPEWLATVRSLAKLVTVSEGERANVTVNLSRR